MFELWSFVDNTCENTLCMCVCAISFKLFCWNHAKYIAFRLKMSWKIRTSMRDSMCDCFVPAPPRALNCFIRTHHTLVVPREETTTTTKTHKTDFVTSNKSPINTQFTHWARVRVMLIWISSKFQTNPYWHYLNWEYMMEDSDCCNRKIEKPTNVE